MNLRTRKIIFFFFFLVSFPPLVGRPKNRKNGEFVLIGNELDEVNNSRLKVRTPFDTDVVCDFETMVIK